MADQQYQLKQRERITLGLLAQHESLSASELTRQLALADDRQALSAWLGRLQDFGLVEQSGRTKGTRYSLNPSLRRDLQLQVRTTLQRIEPHRLEALILEDLRRYPSSSMGEINGRIGLEISRNHLKRAVQALANQGDITFTGEKRGRRYSISSSKHQ
jgi:ATP-dependent DNA helicase RecG